MYSYSKVKVITIAYQRDGIIDDSLTSERWIYSFLLSTILLLTILTKLHTCLVWNGKLFFCDYSSKVSHRECIAIISFLWFFFNSTVVANLSNSLQNMWNQQYKWGIPMNWVKDKSVWTDFRVELSKLSRESSVYLLFHQTDTFVLLWSPYDLFLRIISIPISEIKNTHALNCYRLSLELLSPDKLQ